MCVCVVDFPFSSLILFLPRTDKAPHDKAWMHSCLHRPSLLPHFPPFLPPKVYIHPLLACPSPSRTRSVLSRCILFTCSLPIENTPHLLQPLPLSLPPPSSHLPMRGGGHGPPQVHVPLVLAPLQRQVPHGPPAPPQPLLEPPPAAGKGHEHQQAVGEEEDHAPPSRCLVGHHVLGFFPWNVLVFLLLLLLLFLAGGA